MVVSVEFDPRSSRLAGIVFDLDGVLIDSEAVIYTTWSECFSWYGASFTLTEWCTRVGSHQPDRFDPYSALVERATKKVAPRVPLVGALRALQADEIDRRGPLPGVTSWLAEAKTRGLRVGVATSSSRAWLTERLDAIGLLDEFDALVSPEDGFSPKPAPDLYIEACRRLNVHPTAALAVEDSISGLEAARSADMIVLAVPSTVTQWMDFSSAHHQVDSLLDPGCEGTLRHLEKVVTNAHEQRR
jgi:HAD superfamily hydrolase (TIGR01509 family)